MRTLTIKDLKNNGSKAISNNEVSYLIVNSEPKSAIVPLDQYEMLIDALEELEDIKDTIARLNEEETPADEVLAELLKE